MFSSMDSALSALGAFGKKMDVTANNIANVNTIGFKGSTFTFTLPVLKDKQPG